MFLDTDFFRFLIITFCIGFMQTEKKYVKVTDDNTCNSTIEFKAKSEIMKRNRHCKNVDNEIWEVFKM